MTITFERRIELDGATNFRDLGGYETSDGRAVRWRRVFRSDGLHDLSEDDVAALVEIGLSDVFDLRTALELEAFGTNPLTEQGVAHHHVPFIADIKAEMDRAAVPAAERPDPDDHAAHADAYLKMLERGQAAVARVLTHLAEGPERAAVFHCTGGRDRTGMTAALLLHALGVPREAIAADYALTTRYLAFTPERMARLRELYGTVVTGEQQQIPPTHAEVILLTLEGLDDRYGSPEAYLEEAGVTEEHRDALRSTLLEDWPPTTKAP